MGLKIYIALGIFSIVFSLNNGVKNPCKARKFNHDSVVCVCSDDYCDNPGPINRTQRGLMQIFESTREGKRLAYREKLFESKPIPVDNRSIIPLWNVTIDRNKTFNEIIGFGGSWSDAAGISVGSLSESLQKTLLSSYFSKNGIEYSMARSVISGCDFSTRAYSYDDTEFEDWKLSNWSLVDEDNLYKIPQMKLAQELSGNSLKYFASSWSPPAWMKTNNKLMRAGSLKEGAGSKYWQIYAKYLLRYFDEYKKHDVNFWGMTVQNEPETGFEEWFPWNTCGFTSSMERDFLKTDLGPTLEKGGYTPENFNIMVLDHNRNQVIGWVDKTFDDPEASKYAKGSAVHWYGNPDSSIQVYDRLHHRFPDKFILATEACNRGDDNDKVALGRWSLGEQYAEDIINDLMHWVGGWIDWNLALDTQGGPNWTNNFHSSPIIVNATANEFYKNTQFYAMAHFSKFLPPGSKRISTNDGQLVENEKFKLTAFLRPDGAVVVIAINSWNHVQSVILNYPELGKLQVNIEPRSFNSWLVYS